MTEPISEDRLREIHEVAWNPEFAPPAEMTALHHRHELFRDAVREIDRVRGRRTGFHQMRALLEVLGKHRVMYPMPPHGEQPKLLTDLMEWAFVAADCEVQDLTAERDEALADNARLRALVADEHTRVSQELENAAAAREPCPHCPDGHKRPDRQPWSAWVTEARDGDGQPTTIHVARSNSAHVAESDAQWIRKRLNDRRDVADFSQ